MSRKKVNKTLCSIDEEMLMWTSYRYCIGSHTYVNTLAPYIGRKYYNQLSEERLKFTAMDIRKEIGNHLQWSPITFKYSGTVSYEDRKPLEDLFEFLRKYDIDSAEKILEIKEVEVYHETYNTGEEHKYRITKCEPDVRKYASQSDLDDLIPWMNLASLFDKKGYLLVTTNYNGKEEKHVCFKSYTHELVKCEYGDNTYTSKPWSWKPIYVGVNEYLSGTGGVCIADEYITNIEPFIYKEVKND